LLPLQKLADFEENFSKMFKRTNKLMVSAVAAAQRIITGETNYEGLL
jgi:flagellar hook-basal body complex protein FliE